jgi:serine/threonine protein kinase
LEELTERAKLIDFGLVLVEDDEGQITRTGCVVGTPAYMAPEQADGATVDHRSDLYGLGCVLYRSSTGRVPFEGQTYMQVFFAQRTKDPVYPRDIDPTVPTGLADLMMNLLAKDPADRPPSAGVVRDTLRALRSEPSIAASKRDTVTIAAEDAHTSPEISLPTEETLLPPANPWADVVVETAASPTAAAPDAVVGVSIYRKNQLPPRWLWGLVVGSVALLLFAILLATRH